jgi:hypothetical protein
LVLLTLVLGTHVYKVKVKVMVQVKVKVQVKVEVRIKVEGGGYLEGVGVIAGLRAGFGAGPGRQLVLIIA